MPCYSNNEIYYHGDAAVEHTSKQVKKILKSGVNVLSYYLSHWESSFGSRTDGNFKKMYGKSAQTISVTNMIPLAKSLNKMFE